jgi:cell division protein FtsZ
MEVDDDFKSSKPVAKVVEEVIPAELNITMKKLMLQQSSFKI